MLISNKLLNPYIIILSFYDSWKIIIAYKYKFNSERILLVKSLLCFHQTLVIYVNSKILTIMKSRKYKANLVSDKTIIWFGKYKGTKLINIPDEYFQYLLDNNISFRGIKDYSKRRLKLKSNYNDNN